jgi:phosphopantothenoylcysteine decarboxylase
MWAHPATARHTSQLVEWGFVVVEPAAEKKLACGDVGRGAMAPVQAIVNRIRDEVARSGLY